MVTSTLLGKGASMHDGAMNATHEPLGYLDGDLAGLRPGIVSHLARPLLAAEADFALAHTTQIDGDVCTGQIRINRPSCRGAKAKVCRCERARLSTAPVLRAQRVALRLAAGADVGLAARACGAAAKSTTTRIGSWSDER